MTAITTLLLPGLGDSGPDHWQSHWERRDPGCWRVRQAEWDAPRREDWVDVLDAALKGATEPVVLVGHSNACPTIAHWAVRARPPRLARVRAALLVAPADPEGPIYPAGPEGFAPVPMVRLPFPSVVVSSTNDPWVSAERARAFANAWGSRYVELPDAGHINTAAGYGPWPEGWALLEELRALPVRDEWHPWWLDDEQQLDWFLSAFRDGTFPVTWWTHGAHVAMAAAVLWNTPVPQVVDELRDAIRRYNQAQGGENTASMGYHETLTRLWVGAVAATLAAVPPGESRLAAVRQAYKAFARRAGFFREWYSFDLLASTQARREWVAPEGERVAMVSDIFTVS